MPRLDKKIVHKLIIEAHYPIMSSSVMPQDNQVSIEINKNRKEPSGKY